MAYPGGSSYEWTKSQIPNFTRLKSVFQSITCSELHTSQIISMWWQQWSKLGQHNKYVISKLNVALRGKARVNFSLLIKSCGTRLSDEWWMMDRISIKNFFSLFPANYRPQRKVSTINPLTANPTKWSNTLKQFFSNSRRIFWSCLTILWVGT